jgi:6-phosphogluconolactonase
MMAQPFVIQLNDEGTYHLNVQPDGAALTRLAANAFVFFVRKAIERRGWAHAALSGGSTPRALFEVLATAEFARAVLWERVHVWWGDERCVPPEHVDSNYRMAHEALLRRVPIPAENVHRVRTELGAVAAAAEYEREMREAFDMPAGAAGWPAFDLILLGMGDDGHTASLFPGTAALEPGDRLVVANPVAKLAADRITFTAPLINAADTVIFLVAGAGKASMLRRVLLGEYEPAALPAQGILPVGKLFWMTDAAAAALVADGPSYPAGEFIYRRASA